MVVVVYPSPYRSASRRGSQFLRVPIEIAIDHERRDIVMYSIIILCFLAQFCASEFHERNFQAEATFQEISLGHHRERRQQQHQAPAINYRPFSHAPANIKQLLQYQQAREPIVNIPVQKPPQLGPAQGHGAQAQHQPSQAQIAQYRPQVQYGSAPAQPTYNNIKPQAAAAPQYPAQQQQAYPQYRNNPAQQQPQQPNYKALYRPVQGPSQEPQIQYSKQIPAHLQQLIQSHRP